MAPVGERPLFRGRIGVFIFAQSECASDAVAATVTDILTGTYSDFIIEVVSTQDFSEWPDPRVIRRTGPLSLIEISQAKYDYLLIANAGDRFDRSFLSRCMAVADSHVAVYSDYQLGATKTVALPDWDRVWIQYQNYVQAPVFWDTSYLITTHPFVPRLDMEDARSVNWSLLRNIGRRNVAHIAAALVSIPAQDLCIHTYAPKPLYERVSIIIPTNGSDIALLRRCLESIIARTVYPGEYEILLLDNSRRRAAPALYDYFGQIREQDRVRYVEADIEFNWAALNNLGVRASASDIFVFLNDDTEVISPQWLTDLVDVFRWPSVGVVGAQLLFPDGTIQHAGVTLVPQMSGAAHIGYKKPPHTLGMWNSAPRSVAAVTGACQAVTRAAYNSARGFNENYLVIASDIAFCLAVRRAGYEVAYNPMSLLYHHEMVSRKTPSYPNDTRLLWKEWGRTLKAGDPYYPNVYRKLRAGMGIFNVIWHFWTFCCACFNHLRRPPRKG